MLSPCRLMLRGRIHQCLQFWLQKHVFQIQVLWIGNRKQMVTLVEHYFVALFQVCAQPCTYDAGSDYRTPVCVHGHEEWCVSLHGQTPFHMEGRGLGHGHHVPCRSGIHYLCHPVTILWDNLCQVRLPTLLHSHFRFLLHSSSRLEALLA